MRGLNMNNFQIHTKALDEKALYNEFCGICKELNYGAFLSFSGIIRAEGDISGLSFDIYEPLLKKWFDSWCEKTKDLNVKLFFAHTKGDVLVGECSYFAGIASSHRKNGLSIFAEFVEDFKQNAPIWKYDLINNERIYAKDRSFKLPNAGILGISNRNYK